MTFLETAAVSLLQLKEARRGQGDWPAVCVGMQGRDEVGPGGSVGGWEVGLPQVDVDSAASRIGWQIGRAVLERGQEWLQRGWKTSCVEPPWTETGKPLVEGAWDPETGSSLGPIRWETPQEDLVERRCLRILLGRKPSL